MNPHKDLDAICQHHDLQIAPMAGDKLRLLACEKHRTVPVAEVEIDPKRVTPTTNKAKYSRALQALEAWA